LLDLETIDEKQGTIIKKLRDLRTEKQKLVVQRDSEEKSIKRMESEYQNITKSIQVLRSEGEEGKTRAKYVTKMNDLFEKMETKRKSIETIDIKVEKISKTILKEIDKL
jgi:chromosome segregation ATPase